ncbi:uncharacterized protein LOC120123077 [Hibiscus syriacus]|uniref:uncharacterized protein LOC120123077 n=1 Tax=Hibiscus syriacus TaxID=106335 RepID=UPI00192075C3|nr:uncharacterized protein LOC120123077 [Hibiscus syriacus]
MATSPLNVQPSFHARSNSLPSRQHPVTSQIDESLNRLRASQSASTSSSIGHQLNCLQDLYDSVDKLLQLPLAQQSLAKEQQTELIEQLLDGSLMLLDVCGTARDALFQTKECRSSIGPDAESKSSPWSVVSKLMHQKKVICKEEQKTNEIANAEATMRSLIKSGSMKNVVNVQNALENSEMCIQDLDEGLESFFRRLIKDRVTILNILNC